MATITIEPVRHKNVHGKESLYLRLKTVHAEYLMLVGKGSIEWVEEQLKKPEEGDQANNGPELPFKEKNQELVEKLTKDWNELTKPVGISNALWGQYKVSMEEFDVRERITFDKWKKQMNK